MSIARTGRRLHARSMRGASLLEVLVAIVVLAIGMLGVAGMQTNALKFNHTASVRTQATYLAYEIADAMRANFQEAVDGSYDLALNANPPNNATIPAADLTRWRAALTERLPSGTGSIARNAINNTLVTITIQWTEGRLGDGDAQFVFVTEL